MTGEDVKSIAAHYGKEVQFIGRKSPQTKWIKDVVNNKKTDTETYFVIDGIWLHEQAYRSSLQVDSFVVCPKLVYSNESIAIMKQYIQLAQNVYVMDSDDLFQRFSDQDDPHGLLSICKYAKLALDDLELRDTNLMVILDGLETPGNIGTIIRSVDGAGGDAVILCKREGSARMNHPKLIRASQCTCFNIPMVEATAPEIQDWLAKRGFTTFLLDAGSLAHEYHEFAYSKRVAIVAGNERYGISPVWYEADPHRIFIPMFGQIDSLNVGIATSIVLYEASLKQKGHIKR